MLLVQMPWLGSSCPAPGGPTNVGVKLPTDLAFVCCLARPGLGLPLQRLKQPQGRAKAGVGGPPAAPILWHQSAYTEVLFPHTPPSRLSLPWVTQLQLIPLARPGLYLGHGTVQRRRRRAGSRGGGWGVPEAALQEGDGGQGTEDGNRGQAAAHPTPCRSACQVPRSRRSTLT